MKKILSICLALTTILNVNGYAVSPTENQTQPIQKTNIEKTSLSLKNKIAIGATTICGIIGGILVYNNWPRKNSKGIKKEDINHALKDPVHSSEAIKSLENQALIWLREFFTGKNLDHLYKHPHIKEQYDNPSKWLSHQMISLLGFARFAAIENPENVSMIFIENSEANTFFENVKVNMIIKGEENKPSTSPLIPTGPDPLPYDKSKLMELHDKIIRTGTWRSDSIERNYVELFELHREIELCKAFENDTDSVAGFLITENRNFRENEKAEYSVRIVHKNEIYPQN